MHGSFRTASQRKCCGKAENLQTMPQMAAHRSLVIVSGQIGEIKRGEFLQYTNFVFEVVSAVSSPVEACIQLDGFLYKITMTSGVEK